MATIQDVKTKWREFEEAVRHSSDELSMRPALILFELKQAVEGLSEEELPLTVPTYYGALPTDQEKGPNYTYGGKQEWDDPQMPVLIHAAEGLRAVLGSHDRHDYTVPDVHIERRPHGWALFINSLGGSDTAAVVYIHDDGRSWLVKDRSPSTPEMELAEDTPREIDYDNTETGSHT